jgi:hypothetical protein
MYRNRFFEKEKNEGKKDWCWWNRREKKEEKSQREQIDG